MNAMKKITMYDDKRNTLYIATDVIMPKVYNREEYKKAFAMSYAERIKKYCTDKDAKKEIEQELKNHKGCNISEFTAAY